MSALRGGRRRLWLAVAGGLVLTLGPCGLVATQAACTDCDADGVSFPVDCNDANPGILPGAVEVCDGFDNDCNGSVDDNPSCGQVCLQLANNEFDTLVSSGAVGTSQQASVAWTGSGYGVAWRDSRDARDEIYFALISAGGVKLTVDRRITDAIGASSRPSIVWTGTEFGVAWVDTRDGDSEIYFNRIDTAGVPAGIDVRVSAAVGFSGQPDLVWTGAEYALVWADDRTVGNREIYFNRLDEAGLVAGPDIRVTSSIGISEQPSLSWNGNLYGLTWTDERDGNREIYFNRLDTGGVPAGADARITNDGEVSAQSSLVWTGVEFGFAWTDQRDLNREIYFARVSALGVKQGGDIRVTAHFAVSEEPSLDWTGAEFGVAWRDTRASGGDMFLARLDASGVKQGTDLHVNNDLGLVSRAPDLVWTGARHAIVWQDIEINLARVDCDCPDSDGDTFSVCGGDCDDTLATVFPGAPQICDGLNNDCNDAVWPGVAGTNEADTDGDGASVCDGDCDVANGLIWATPGQVRDVRLAHDGASGATTLTWQTPAQPGASTVAYDTVRSKDVTDFVLAATCVEGNGTDLITIDTGGTLQSGEIFYYLLRAENTCPVGQGDLGSGTTGPPRTAKSCP